MTDLGAWYEAREALVDALVADLHGTDADEVLTEEPLDRFIVGVLHPLSATGDQEQVEAADEVPDDGASAVDELDDPGVSFSHLRYPASIGVTCGLSPETRELDVTVWASRYEPLDAQEGEADSPEKEADQARTRGAGDRQRSWALHRLDPWLKRVEVAAGSRTESIAEGLDLRIVVRPESHGVVSVTLALVNTHRKPEKARSDRFCWFRPHIELHAVDGAFVDRRPADRLEHLDEDELSGELLYREERHLAVGHGVGVTWEESDRVASLSTTFFPSHELPLAKAERDDVPPLRMGVLADGNRSALDDLVAAYTSWLGDRSAEVAEGAAGAHESTARTHLERGAEAVRRITRGIEILNNDPEAAAAFAWMNRAMDEQRARQSHIKGDDPTTPTWRPFQIAFILLNLEGIVDESSKERDIADLLWFPTGGGKTEAYLGLIAFTLVLRRLRKKGANGDGAGVGVIMRYTLRLLTLQQFERAASLICALEYLRRSEPSLGTHPFSIGLWVGQAATPNSVDNAQKALRKKRDGEDPGDLGDPVQLLSCPWCGSELGPHDYDVDRASDRMTVRCPGPGCEFRSGLPVHLVDSDVYESRPSLLIGTVDKFAMLAWNEKSGRLFGSGHDAVPDLIIQDELHLISGPLGTLVGLYETAVDHLATSADGVRPKLVASTATIRRASGQVRAVFARESRQFPPPGLDARDSFFAVDAERSEKGTRRYVGLMAPSASHATLLVRTYAALLQAGLELDAPDEVRDAYWTLVGYFNSLRVLGAAYIQSIDDVRDRIKVVAGRNGSAPRDTKSPSELTSRIKSSDIPNELKRLGKSIPDPDCPDTVLATNMISVGVDVDRLGLMAVMGQPQTTSEYIQATSRVGRQRPGLVLTMFNASRSRDLSHYEGFTSYHRALYRQVEATGATPFAARALDRGLHGLLVILARHGISGAAEDSAVTVPVDSDSLRAIIPLVLERASAVLESGTPDPDVEDEVRDSMERLIEQWEDATRFGGVRRYARWRNTQGAPKSLMIPAGMPLTDENGMSLAESFPPSDVPWATLTSLRNVDRESTLKIQRGRRKRAQEKTDGED